jgi:Zn-dependent M28 family amino/carboxypeptidase
VWRVALLAGLVVLLGVPARAVDTPAEARMRRDITFLASDQCEGRGVTTRGINLAADYIAREFARAGLKPAGPDGSYFQPFKMKGATLDGPARIRLRGPQGQEIEWRPGDHIEPLGLAQSGTVTAPVLFAGYGISDPKGTHYDDYEGLDAAGKIVVVLRDTPRAGARYGTFAGARRQLFSSFNYKLLTAKRHGAAAVLFVNDRDTAKRRDLLLHFGDISTADGQVRLPAFHVRRAVVDDMLLATLGRGLADVEAQIDRELKPQSARLTEWTADVDLHVRRTGIEIKNVVGVLEGAGPLAAETVVVGAHYDHLGYGFLFSLSGLKSPAIHHGADDNGSGTTALMELARRFGRLRNRPGRRILFIAFSGEETGLLGSAYYCKRPLYPLAETVAMVNMDMVGRLVPDRGAWKALLSVLLPATFPELPVTNLAAVSLGTRRHLLPPGDKLIVYGTGTAKGFAGLVAHLNERHHFQLHEIASGRGSSDQDSFVDKKLPVLFFFTGDHPDYHRPSDTADKINVPGMARIADLVQDVVNQLTEMPQRPLYVKVPEPKQSRFYGNMPRLGIRPSYGDVEEDEGVLVGGVAEGGPADQAGVREDDRIVELGGERVLNIDAYMAVLMKHKRGEVLTVGVLRNGKRLLLKVKPE